MLYFDFPAVHDVPARGSRDVKFAVTRSLQVICQIRHGQGFSRVDAPRSRINPGRGLLNMSGKPLIDHPAKGDPVVGPNAGGDKDQSNRGPKKEEPNPGSPETPANSNTQGSSPFRREQTSVPPGTVLPTGHSDI